MTNLCFTTTSAWDLSTGFGCASLGLPGVCDNREKKILTRQIPAESVTLTGSYEEILAGAKAVAETETVYAAIVVFGNAGGENAFLADLYKIIPCPMVGGGAAIDGESGRKGLIPGGGEGAVLLFTDSRFTYETQAQCIHDHIIKLCQLTTANPRTILTIDGEAAADFLARRKAELGLKAEDFEHLTLSDMNDVNAHLSCVDGAIKSGRDVHEQMKLRYVEHKDVYETMRAFYDDEDAVVFGCAGLSGLLDQPLDTKSLGLFLFGEVCTVNGKPEFGNLMLSKLKIRRK